MKVSLTVLLFLAQIAARALALVGGRAFARVARKGTIEHAHLRAFLRRLHAAGKIGAGDHSFLELMKQLCCAVAMVARFADQKAPASRAGRAPVAMDADEAPANKDAPRAVEPCDSS